MVKLRSLHGVVVEAIDSAVPRMLDSGFFTLCDGEQLPKPQPEPEDSEDAAEDAAEEEDVEELDLSAFGDGEDEDENLEAMTRAELIALAHSLGLAVPNRATKAAIIDAINESRG